MPPKNQQYSWIKNGKRTYYKKKKGKWVAQKKRRKKPLYKPKKPLSRGTEVIKLTVPPQAAVSLSNNTASAVNGPKNSQIFLSSLWSQHTTFKDSNDADYTPKGAWVKMVYGSKSKFRITFNTLAHHTDNHGGLNLMCHHGICKVPMEKSNSGHSYATAAEFETAVLVLLKKELYNSGITSDFLNYEKQNRNIQIKNSFRIRPSRNDMLMQDGIMTTATVPSTTDTFKSAAFPPPRLITINHSVPKAKTKLARHQGQNYATLPVNLWIPFTLFTCEQLTANSGHYSIEYSSRSYFTDT